ncbi:MAG: hypothetical protein J6V44_09625 [Methanobrevibacter sp.]|nr:hypothetical protein [Methanobrevibacter sp.]
MEKEKVVKGAILAFDFLSSLEELGVTNQDVLNLFVAIIAEICNYDAELEDKWIEEISEKIHLI